MINFGPTFDHKIAISSSRLDSYLHCSAKFYANYFLSIPDKGNSGSSRGSTVHSILEILISDKWLKLCNKIIKANSCKSFPALWRLIEYHARKNSVGDRENLDMIDSFIIVGITIALREKPKGLVKTLVEYPFDFEVVEENISYRVRGFCDLIYLYKVDNSLMIKILDYKSSKQKFSKDKQKNNIQSLIYQNVARRLFPEYKLDSFQFVFMKFVKDPVQFAELVSEDVLRGFELYLTEIQSQLEKFTLANSNDNIAYLDYSKKALCGSGKEGFKDDGSPIWICPARKPMEYWVKLNDKREIEKSYFINEKPNDVTVEKRFYSGCSFFYDKDGKPQTLTFQ